MSVCFFQRLFAIFFSNTRFKASHEEQFMLQRVFEFTNRKRITFFQFGLLLVTVLIAFGEGSRKKIHSESVYPVRL